MVASISAPLRFQVEETEMCARWRSLCPGTPYVAGLTDRSPEERRAPCTTVDAALSQRGLISPGPWAPGLPQPRSPIETTVLMPASSPRKTRLTEPELVQAGPNETRLARVPPGDLQREPVPRDWPLV